MRSSLWCGLIAVVFTLGCDSSPVGLDALAVESELSASVVAPGESLVVSVSVTNPTSRSISYWADVCGLWDLGVVQDGQPVDMVGTRWACTTVLHPPVEIEPGESLRFERELHALTPPLSQGDDHRPMDRGVYTLTSSCACGFPTQRFAFEVR